MSQKEWVAEVEGHSIRVVNSWTGGAKLYVDGECRDTFDGTFPSSDTPSLSGRLEPGKPDSPLVEIFLKALFTVKAKICVSGKQIAGDVF